MLKAAFTLWLSGKPSDLQLLFLTPVLGTGTIALSWLKVKVFQENLASSLDPQRVTRKEFHSKQWWITNKPTLRNGKGHLSIWTLALGIEKSPIIHYRTGLSPRCTRCGKSFHFQQKTNKQTKQKLKKTLGRQFDLRSAELWHLRQLAEGNNFLGRTTALPQASKNSHLWHSRKYKLMVKITKHTAK